MKSTTTCAQAVAPEDIRIGDYLAILHYVSEETPMLLGAESTFVEPKVARMTLMSWDTDPKRVIALCLPFVLVEEPDASRTTLDARRFRLARVSRRFGKSAFEKCDKNKEPCGKKKKHKRI